MVPQLSMTRISFQEPVLPSVFSGVTSCPGGEDLDGGQTLQTGVSSQGRGPASCSHSRSPLRRLSWDCRLSSSLGQQSCSRSLLFQEAPLVRRPPRAAYREASVETDKFQTSDNVTSSGPTPAATVQGEGNLREGRGWGDGCRCKPGRQGVSHRAAALDRLRPNGPDVEEQRPPPSHP